MDDLHNHRTVPEYNTRAVVHRTGVPADTFRAWERRYGLPSPARTQGNQRLYSERDIAIISLLKRMTNDGVSISHAVAKAHRQIEGTAFRPTANVPATPGSAGLGVLQGELVSAFIAFDTRHANRLVEDATALIDVETLCMDIIQPALVDIGDQWARGTLAASVEHFASAFCMRKLSALLNASQPEIGAPTVLCSCVEGEHHEIGLMMISVLLSRAGFRVIYLGSNLPGAELLSAVTRIRPDVVALSSTTIATYRALLDTISHLRQLGESGVQPIIGYGGALFDLEPDRRRSVPANYLGPDARAARRRLDELLAVQARPKAQAAR